MDFDVVFSFNLVSHDNYHRLIVRYYFVAVFIVKKRMDCKGKSWKYFSNIYFFIMNILLYIECMLSNFNRYTIKVEITIQ